VIGVYPSSVPEHLGVQAARTSRFAADVRELGLRNQREAQTPYRYVPSEPRWLLRGFQFSPLNVRPGISRR
jgi:hypothetical protein